MSQRHTDDKTNSDERKKNWATLACSAEVVEKQPAVLADWWKDWVNRSESHVNANSALSQILHISPEDNQEKAEMTDVISTSKSQQNHCQ